jgi:hypothetical protein
MDELRADARYLRRWRECEHGDYRSADSGVTIGGDGRSEGVSESKAIGMPWGIRSHGLREVALQPQHWIVYCNYYMLGGLITELEKHAKLGTVFVWRKSNAPIMTRNVPRLDCEFIVWAKDRKARNIRVGEFRSQVLDVPMPQAGCFATERITWRAAAHNAACLCTAIDRKRANRPRPSWVAVTGMAGVELDPHYFAIAERRIAIEQPPLLLPDAPAIPAPEQSAMFGD